VSDERIGKSLSEGIPGTSMPPYGRLLSDSERNDLLDLTFSTFIGINRLEKDALRPLPPYPSQLPPRAEGERLFQKNCARCHGKAGTGTGPEYLGYQPRPRNLRNVLFLASINDDRIARSVYDGVAGTAMPSFRDKLKPNDLWAVVEQVRQFSGTGERGGRT
jgi:mono/diheme cytochrome c family protein